MSTFRVLICGGRDYADSVAVERRLEAGRARLAGTGRELVVIEGGASGADAFAHRWAHRNGVKLETYPADWEAHGKAAGPIRNAHMLSTMPDVVLAFPGGRGTADMVRRARLAGIPVVEVEP